MPHAFPRAAPATRDVVGDQRQVLLRMLRDGALDLPLPGLGRTWDRWQALARFGATDLVLGRLAEGHTDAVAILAEAGRSAPAGHLLGVWASANEGTGLRSTRTSRGWVLDGVLRFASGARVLDDVLLTAETDDGRVLAVVDVATLEPVDGTWQAVGMADSDSLDVRAHGVEVSDDEIVGPAGFYVDRPGLAVGGMGVAAVWWGGASGLVTRLLAAARTREPSAHHPGPHVAAHLGACWSAVRRGETLLRAAAHEVDAAPRGDHSRLALHVRHEVEQIATEVLERAGRATGATPLCRDADYARLAADLTVFVRQQHAERDLEALGRSVLAAPEALDA